LLETESKAIREKPTSSMEAYESYLRGIDVARQYEGWWDKRRDAEAVRWFETAIRHDPTFSGAYSSLANFLLAVMGLSRSFQDTVPRARECVTKALELNPNSSDAHTAAGNLALQSDMDWTRAEAEFQQAISLNPSSSTAHFWYGYLLFVLQRYSESTKQYRAAIDLDPLWLLPRTNMAWNYSLSGDSQTTLSMLEKLVADYPEDARITGGLAELHGLRGEEVEALRWLGANPGDRDRAARVTRAEVLALLGKLDELRALMEDYEAGRLDWYVALPSAAGAYVLLGDNERALTLLEADMKDGERLLWSSYQGPLFDPIRDDPRFLALLRSANLPTTLSRPRWTGPVRTDR